MPEVALARAASDVSVLCFLAGAVLVAWILERLCERLIAHCKRGER